MLYSHQISKWMTTGFTLLFLAGSITVHGSWRTDRGQNGNTNLAPGEAGVTPPVSLFGKHEFGQTGTQTSLVADNDHYYIAGDAAVQALERIFEHEETGPYSTNDVLWEFRPMDGWDFEDGVPNINSQIVLTSDLVVFTKTVLDGTDHNLYLIGLDKETGNEVWRYSLGNGTDPQLTTSGFDRLFLFYMDTSEDPFGDATVVRIAAGDTEPEAVRSQSEGLDFPSPPKSLVARENQVVLHYASEVLSLNTFNLNDRWRHTETSEDHGDAVDGSRHDLIINSDNHVFISLAGSHYYSMTENGTLRWATTIDLPDDCTGESILSMSPHGLVATNVCRGIMLLFDEETGEEIIRIDTPETTPIPPVIQGDLVYLATLETGYPELVILSLPEGEEVERFALDSLGSPYMSLGIVDEHLVGLRGALMGTALTVVEMQPASVTTRIEGMEEYHCGAFINNDLDLVFHVENEGPGNTRGAEVTLESSRIVNYDIDVPDGVDIDTIGSTVEFDFGDMEPGTIHEIPMTITPQSAGEVILESDVDLVVRNTAENQGGDTVSLQVAAAPSEDATVEITHVEITQGLQDFDQSIPLIARRDTLIRVYIEADEDIGPIGGHVLLSGSYMDGPIPESFSDVAAIPLAECHPIDAEPDQFRTDLGTSFNFILPPKLLNHAPMGEWDLEIELDPAGLLAIDDRSGLVHTTSFGMDTVPPICIISRPLLTTDDDDMNLRGPSAIPGDVMNRAVALLPTHEIINIPKGSMLTRSGSSPFHFDPDKSYDTFRMLSRLQASNVLSSRPDECKDAGAPVLHYAIAHEDTRDTGRGGVAFRGRSAGSFRMGLSERIEYNNPPSGTTLAHEIGHNLGRRHVNCGGPDDVDPDYPHDPCFISTVSSTAFFGVDLYTPTAPRVIDPGVHDTSDIPTDLLAYGNARWPSDYNWMAMYDELMDQKAQFEERRNAPVYLASSDDIAAAWMESWKGESGREIIFSAIVDPGVEGEIDILMPVNPTTMGEEARAELALATREALGKETRFMVELLDGNDEVILEVPLEDGFVDDTLTPDNRLLTALLPKPDGLESLRLVDQSKGTELARADRSPNAPEVVLLHPEENDVVEDELVIDWDASDPDGNDLEVAVQYSADDGETWTALALNAGEAPAMIDISTMQGGIDTVRLRLIVSDGFNTTEVVSDPFTVVPRDPITKISRPADGVEVHLGTPIFARSQSFDPEDGVLRGDALVWELEDHGEVGTGETVLLTDLALGTHRLILTATDSDGQESTDEIDIHVVTAPATRDDVLRVITGRTSFTEGMGLDRNLDGTVDAADLMDPEDEDEEEN